MIKPYYETTQSKENADQLREQSNRLDREMSFVDCVLFMVTAVFGCWVFWYFLTMYRG